jgi:SpoVK/Ycf46/Vps4 family AAA+-type ATPase
MTARNVAPGWAAELALAFESGAHSQFLLHGNVHDRFAHGGRLINFSEYLEAELLKSFQVVFVFDLGNGLRVERGGELLEKWKGEEGLREMPREALPAIRLVSHFVRYLANLRALKRGGTEQVACVLRGADQILPADGGGHEHGSLTSLVRDWAMESPFAEHAFASLLITDNLHDVEPLVAYNPRAVRVRIPMPDADGLGEALQLLRKSHPGAFEADGNLAQIAAGLVGVTATAVESVVRRRAREKRVLAAADFVQVKKELIERDAAGLVEFVESQRTLDDFEGHDPVKRWLRQDVQLWRSGDLRALPMGYLFCGPVGTGKTFLVHCLAGEAGVPVIVLKNFRDRWVGSSEGNLERIFRLVRALGRCMVFIDEADQALGRRTAGTGDSGVSGRLYAMIAQEMSDTRNRGKTMWLLASSRPDLIEVDLKRPGRIDVKIPLLPTTTVDESARLLAALARRYGLALDAQAIASLGAEVPILLTPGAAEALVVKTYRIANTRSMEAVAALRACLEGYQHPVPRDVLEFQIALAVREATDLEFVAPSLRGYAQPTAGTS